MCVIVAPKVDEYAFNPSLLRQVINAAYNSNSDGIGFVGYEKEKKKIHYIKYCPSNPELFIYNGKKKLFYTTESYELDRRGEPDTYVPSFASYEGDTDEDQMSVDLERLYLASEIDGSEEDGYQNYDSGRYYPDYYYGYRYIEPLPQELVDRIIELMRICGNKWLLHARLRSTGKVDLAHTHPFYFKGYDNRAGFIVHNGTLIEFCSGRSYMENDTLNFARFLTRELVKRKISADEAGKILSIVSTYVGGDKFGILTPSGHVLLVGRFVSESGLLASNHSCFSNRVSVGY
jgi:hypothetical protein